MYFMEFKSYRLVFNVYKLQHDSQHPVCRPEKKAQTNYFISVTNKLQKSQFQLENRAKSLGPNVHQITMDIRLINIWDWGLWYLHLQHGRN